MKINLNQSLNLHLSHRWGNCGGSQDLQSKIPFLEEKHLIPSDLGSYPVKRP